MPAGQFSPGLESKSVSSGLDQLDKGSLLDAEVLAACIWQGMQSQHKDMIGSLTGTLKGPADTALDPHIEAAEQILDQQNEQNKGLTVSDRAMLKEMEHLILEGKVAELQKFCQGFGDHYLPLAATAERCKRELEPAGISISFEEGCMPGSDGQPSHMVAMIHLMSKSGGTALRFTNDKEIGIGISGPFVRDSNGNYRADLLGFTDEPELVLARIGREAAARIFLTNG
jgi:hypothetical protein